MTRRDRRRASPVGQAAGAVEPGTPRPAGAQWLPVLPALAAALAYAGTLRHGFVWDEGTFLVDLPLYRDPALGWRALLEPFPISPNYFRPLAVLTFMLEIRLGGLDPTGPHAVNVALHALNAALVTHLARRLAAPGAGPGRVLALGLAYALHPALVEGVAFVSSRFDLLFTTLALLTLLADIRLAHPIGRPLAVAGLFLAAALAKEMAVTLPLVLVCWRAARATDDPRPGPAARLRAALLGPGALATNLALLAAGAGYLGIRRLGLGYLLPPGMPHLPAGDALQHGLLVARSVAEYLRVALWPFTSLTPIHHTALPVSPGDPAAWTAAMLLGAALAGLALAVRRVPATGWPLVAAAVSLAPVVNLVPLDLTGGAFVAERFLLFPLALTALAGVTVRAEGAMGRILAGSPAARRAGAALAAAWLVASAVTVRATVPHWRSNATLWRWAVTRAPASPTPLVNLALEQHREGDPVLALATARRAVELGGGAMAWNNAGLALFHLGRLDEAHTHFAEAARLGPANALFWSNLGAVLLDQGRLAEAERVLREEALRRNPAHPLAHLNLGALHLRRDRPDLAGPALERAVALAAPAEQARARAFLARTRDPAAWLRLGDRRLGEGDAPGALGAFDRAAALGAGAADVAVGRSAALLQAAGAPGAAAAAEAGLQAAPGDARLHVNLALAARRQGDLGQARRHLERAAALRPDWDLPRRSLADLGR